MAKKFSLGDVVQVFGWNCLVHSEDEYTIELINHAGVIARFPIEMIKNNGEYYYIDQPREKV